MFRDMQTVQYANWNFRKELHVIPHSDDVEESACHLWRTAAAAFSFGDAVSALESTKCPRWLRRISLQWKGLRFISYASARTNRTTFILIEVFFVPEEIFFLFHLVLFSLIHHYLSSCSYRWLLRKWLSLKRTGSISAKYFLTSSILCGLHQTSLPKSVVKVWSLSLEGLLSSRMKGITC